MRQSQKTENKADYLRRVALEGQRKQERVVLFLVKREFRMAYYVRRF
jgi:hypothetical protein